MRTVLPVLGFRNEEPGRLVWRPHDLQTGYSASLLLSLSATAALPSTSRRKRNGLSVTGAHGWPLPVIPDNWQTGVLFNSEREAHGC